jgi:hypothetical protein
VGKTRLAIEYARAHEADYSALLFVRSDDPTTFFAGIAALCGTLVLDLPEKEETDEAAKFEAVLRWLEANPAWLMILDNVDDDQARDPVIDLLPRLKNGRIVITARDSNFPAGVLTIELGVLDEAVATAFLLDRTHGRRAEAADDPQQARVLAEELGGLALGMEQAAAYIAKQRVSISSYLNLWRNDRDKALKWFDPKLMGYGHEKGLAATWEVSVNRLSPESRRMLDRLAMLAPNPILNGIFEVAVPGEPRDYDTLEAVAGLYAYSLVTPVSHGNGIMMHRLVQDFARRAMTEARRNEALQEALEWVNAAFLPTSLIGSLGYRWLWPHALAVAQRAEAAGIHEPTISLLMSLSTPLLFVPRKIAEREQAARGALRLAELRYGPDDPTVGYALLMLAVVVAAIHGRHQAAPLIDRALTIAQKMSAAGDNRATLLRIQTRLFFPWRAALFP